MKNYKYCLFFVSLLFVSSTAFAETTLVERQPNAYIIHGNRGETTYIERQPNELIVHGNRGETIIEIQPNAYIIHGNRDSMSNAENAIILDNDREYRNSSDNNYYNNEDCDE